MLYNKNLHYFKHVTHTQIKPKLGCEQEGEGERERAGERASPTGWGEEREREINAGYPE